MADTPTPPAGPHPRGQGSARPRRRRRLRRGESPSTAASEPVPGLDPTRQPSGGPEPADGAVGPPERAAESSAIQVGGTGASVAPSSVPISRPNYGPEWEGKPDPHLRGSARREQRWRRRVIVAKARAAKDLPEVADTLLALMREARTPSEKRKCAQAIARFAGELPNHQVTLNVAQASSPTVAVSNLNDTELAHWLDAVAHGLAEVREAKRHEAPETNGHEPRE